jgi:O-antigen/teichoic acid export membrane protein
MSINFKSIINHGRNYLIASFATSALAFISMPIYTRILTPQDYGIISIYAGFVGILATIISFSTDRSVSRYFFDKKDDQDFKNFVGTTTILTVSFFTLNSIMIYFFSEIIGKYIGVNKYVVYLMIPMSLVNIVSLLFEQIYGPLKKSKEIAISSVIKVFLGFVFSVLFILLFKGYKYYGQIIGQIIAGLIMIFIWIRLIKPYFKLSFNVSYIKYIFSFSVPLIPYALSGVIIEQFGKIAIGASIGMSEAGFYNLALTISSIVNIAISVTHQAWSPYYFEYMNEKKYDQLDNDYIIILKFTLLIAFGVACFGKEIGFLLAKKEFSGAFYLIPIFSIGYIFLQLSFGFIRNFSYTKKTYFMTITILFSGICNVVFNSIFIEKYGSTGAAWSFVLSYFIMYLFAWFINNNYVKLHTTPFKSLLKPIIITIPFYLVMFYIFNINSFIVEVLIKFLFFIFFSFIILWDYRKIIFSYLKDLYNTCFL